MKLELDLELNLEMVVDLELELKELEKELEEVELVIVEVASKHTSGLNNKVHIHLDRNDSEYCCHKSNNSEVGSSLPTVKELCP